MTAPTPTASVPREATPRSAPSSPPTQVAVGAPGEGELKIRIPEVFIYYQMVATDVVN